MKYAFFVLAFLSFVFVNDASAQKGSKDRDNYEIKVDGLGCPFCAYGLEKKFKDFKGIKNVKIDMETGKFTFTYPASTPLTVAQVEGKVEEAGYTPVRTKITRTDGTVDTSKEKEAVVISEENLKTVTINVSGNCGMCKSRIERTALATGAITSAEWDSDSQGLTVDYDASKMTVRDIEAAIAKVGHDTENVKADDDTYKSLPPCCKYR